MNNHDPTQTISARITHLQREIAYIAKACGSAKPTIIAASKTRSEQEIRIAYDSGITHFGENYGQELRDKRAALKDLNIQWHYFGRLQRNKIKYVVGPDCLIHSIDRLSILDELYKKLRASPARNAPTIDFRQHIMLQLNVTEEKSKAGFSIEELDAALYRANTYKDRISCVGFMTMLPFQSTHDEQATWFREMRNLANTHSLQIDSEKPDDIEKVYKSPTCLSMGMSDDYQTAITFGATHLRLGRAIFGNRSGKLALRSVSLLILLCTTLFLTRSVLALKPSNAAKQPFTVEQAIEKNVLGPTMSHGPQRSHWNRNNFPWTSPMYCTYNLRPIAKRQVQYRDLWEHVVLRFSQSQYGPFDNDIVSASIRWHLDPFILKGLLDNESRLEPVAEGKRIYMVHDGNVSIISGGAVGIAQFTTIGIEEVNAIRDRLRAKMLFREVASAPLQVKLSDEHLAPFSRNKARVPRLAIYAAAELLSSHIRRFGRDGGITAYNSGNAAARAVATRGFYAARSMVALRKHNNTLLQGYHFLINVLGKANKFRKTAGLSALIPA